MKAVSSHEVLAASSYQVRKKKFTLSGKPANFMGVLEHLGHAARELGAASVLSDSTQIISMESVAILILAGIFVRYL